MRQRFEGSCNMNILNWKLYRKIDFIRTWSSQKVEFLSEITSFLPLKLEDANYLFPVQRLLCAFCDPAEYWFWFFPPKIMKGSCVFCCLSCISFNPTSHLKNFAKLTGKHLRQSLLFNKVAGAACNFIKKETVAQVFPCQFCEFFRNNFLTEHLRVTSSLTPACKGSLSASCFVHFLVICSFGFIYLLYSWAYETSMINHGLTHLYFFQVRSSHPEVFC